MLSRYSFKTHGMPFCRSRSSFGIVMTYRCHWQLSSKSWVGAFMQCKGQPLPSHCIRRESASLHWPLSRQCKHLPRCHTMKLSIVHRNIVQSLRMSACTVFLHHFRKMVLITSSYMYTPPLNIHVCVYPISLHLCLVYSTKPKMMPRTTALFVIYLHPSSTEKLQ